MLKDKNPISVIIIIINKARLAHSDYKPAVTLIKNIIIPIKIFNLV